MFEIRRRNVDTEEVKRNKKVEEHDGANVKRVLNCGRASTSFFFLQTILFRSSSCSTYGDSCSFRSSDSILSLDSSSSFVSEVYDATSSPRNVATASSYGRSIGNTPKNITFINSRSHKPKDIIFKIDEKFLV